MYTYSVMSETTSEKVYVKTTSKAINNREFFGGFRRFLQEIYDDKPLNVVEGQKVMTLKEFDEWLNVNVYFIKQKLAEKRRK